MIGFPDETFCAGRTAPVPSTSVSTRTLFGDPGTIVNAVLSMAPGAVEIVFPVAVNVYPIPDLSIDKPAKTA